MAPPWRWKDSARWVLNSSAGPVAEVEGSRATLESFVEAVRHDPPPLAWIQEMQVSEVAALGETAFVIRQSLASTGEFALISPDVATCADCVADLTGAAN